MRVVVDIIYKYLKVNINSLEVFEVVIESGVFLFVEVGISFIQVVGYVRWVVVKNFKGTYLFGKKNNLDFRMN